MFLTYRYLGFADSLTIPGVGRVKRGGTIEADTATVHRIEETTRHRFELVPDDDLLASLLESDDQFAKAAGSTEEVAGPADTQGEPEDD